MKTKATAVTSTKSAAAGDFLSFIHDWGHPEWVVLAVEAPIDQVLTVYASVSSARKRYKNVPVRARRKKDNEMAPLVVIVQPKENAWSIILRIVCLPIDMPDITNAQSVCQTISKKLKTRALAFVGEDTSFAMSYIIYQNGKVVSSKDWQSQRDSADRAFDELGIYLPACYPRREGSATWVCAAGPSLDHIQRADIVDLGKI